MTRSRRLVLAALVSCACVPPPETGDAGTTDGGTTDGGGAGGGSTDGGSTDAGTPDAGIPDAGTTDAGRSVEDRLAAWLAGNYDTRDQSLADPNFFNIRLSMCRVTAPELGPRVLYVEQAMALSATPYRQRLYVVESEPDAGETARSRVFELVNPRAAVGACERSMPVTFVAADAEERPGCVVRLAWQADAGAFVGGTDGQTCLSSLSGASYATTEVTLTTGRLVSLDRGWAADGGQRWGSTRGPYIFIRRSTPPEP